jgi:hypothetical protein
MGLKKAPTRIASGAYDGELCYGVFQGITDDAVAAVETNGYLDEHADSFTEGVGDIIHIVIDKDGTPALKTYLVTRTAGDIALTASS